MVSIQHVAQVGENHFLFFRSRVDAKMLPVELGEDMSRTWSSGISWNTFYIFSFFSFL